MAELSRKRDVTTKEAGAARDASFNRESEVALRPPCDIWEDAESIVMQIDMPGVSRDQLVIETEKDGLLVEGSAQIEMPDGLEALYADVQSTRYRRSFALSRDLDRDKIAAKLKDGVLTLHIPKREEVRPRKITVRTE